MATECVAEMEKRPRKRARLTWDVVPHDEEEEVGLCVVVSLWFNPDIGSRVRAS